MASLSEIVYKIVSEREKIQNKKGGDSMPVPQVVKVASQWGIYTWTDGFTSSVPALPLEKEVKRNPEAVINRLMKEERWDEAEGLLALL